MENFWVKNTQDKPPQSTQNNMHSGVPEDPHMKHYERKKVVGKMAGREDFK